MKKTYVGVRFDVSNMTAEQIQAIKDAETSLAKAGIFFGKSIGAENGKMQDITWDWDFDLFGPVRVELRETSKNKHI